MDIKWRHKQELLIKATSEKKVEAVILQRLSACSYVGPKGFIPQLLQEDRLSLRRPAR